MEFRDLVEQRVSVRQFRAEPVDPNDVREMVRLAGLAPSPNNSQPWRFVAVTKPALLRDMAATVRSRVQALLPVPEDDEGRRTRQFVEWSSTFFADAPLVIAVLVVPYASVVQGMLEGSGLTGAQVNAMRGQPDIQSVGAAVEHLLLAAADLGYGGCWMSGPLVAREALERLLEIQAPGRLSAIVAIGRPTSPQEKGHDRKPLEEILRVID